MLAPPAVVQSIAGDEGDADPGNPDLLGKRGADFARRQRAH
jgi:hypothetical protein